MKLTIELSTLEEFRSLLEWMESGQGGAHLGPQEPTPVEKSSLSPRTRNCLLAESIMSIEDALAMTDSKLLSITNFGPKSLKELRAWRPAKVAFGTEVSKNAGPYRQTVLNATFPKVGLSC